MAPNLFALLLASMILILMTGMLAQQVNKVIMVDDYAFDDGSAKDNGSGLSQFACVQYTSMIYTCPSFETALEILENNTIINITTNMVLLQSIVHLTQLNNIAIVGLNMTTVECNDTGVLNCFLCSNVSIRGITWNKCGTYMEIYNDDLSVLPTCSYPGIIFSKGSNIFIQHCVFQNSMSSAVYLSEASGVINIDSIKFQFNGKRKFGKGEVKTLENAATGLTILQPASIKAATELNISITRCTFSNNGPGSHNLGFSSILLIHSNSISTNMKFHLSESTFISNGIFLSPKSVGPDTPVSVVSINILQYLEVASMIFSEVTFESNRMLLSDHSSILELYITPKQFAQVNIQMTSCDFINNTAFDVVSFQKQFTLGALSKITTAHNQGNSFDATKYNTSVSLNKTAISETVIDGCIFRQTVAGRSVLHLKSTYNDDIYNDQFTITNSTFEDNSETVIYVMGQHVTFKDMIQFTDNIAEYGATMYLGMGSSISFDEDCDVTFTNNFARSYGGAIFYDATQLSSTCENTHMPIQVHNNSAVSFTSNEAGIAGNSIYLSVSQSCNISSLLDVVCGFNFSETNGHLVTSPKKVVLHFPAKLISSTNSIAIYKVRNIMLGQAVTIPTCVLDYQNNSAGKVLFQVTRVDSNQNYSLIAPNFMSLDCESFRVSDIQVIGNPVGEGDNISVTIQFTSSYNSALNWTPIKVNLIIELSPCRPGYFYDDEMKLCKCYKTDNIVSCSDGNATIKRGYWFGMVNNKTTMGGCPLNYCVYKNCESSTRVCTLPSSLDEQCMPHRTGPACSKCVEGYTLSFDSVHCVKSSECTVGMTILVVLITLIYWAVITVVVFGLMYIQVNIGYFYAIIYFYSMLYILFESTLHPLNNAFLYTLVAVLSGLAKLTPRFIGELCFTKGLSGIDQQIIHYIHPIAIWLVIIMITISARFSRRISTFISRGIIRVICLLILLSFTSGASSTSFLIVYAYRYADINVSYIHVSPDILFFQGRHLYYFIVACIFVILIVYGLPLLLLIEPFANRMISFTKIKPLLDQFQGCYKDRFRWFASYYMICRQVILNIVVRSYNNFMPLNLLLVACTVINLIHWLVRPYTRKALNIYDGLVLQTMMAIVALQIIYFDDFESLVPTAAAFVLVMLPIIMLLIMAAYLNVEHVKKFFRPCFVTLKLMKRKKAHRQTTILRKVYDVTVDHELRNQSTTIVGVHDQPNQVDVNDLDRVSFQESLLEVITDTM